MADETTDESEESSQPGVLLTRDAAHRGKIFVFSVLASATVHATVLLLAFFAFEHSTDYDADIEWLRSFDRLEAIGHGGAGDRWASAEDLEKLEQKPKEEEAEPEEPQEPEEPEETEEPEEPEKPDKPEEPQETKPEAPAAAVKTAEKRELKKREKKEPKNAFEGKELPGLDRSGPNSLPAMEGYGPGNAIFSAILRLDRLRGTPFEEPTRRVLEVVPDYRIALEGTGIDPVKDLDSLFMASAAPQYLQQTFLAVRHNLSTDAMKEKLDRRFESEIKWSKYREIPIRELVPADSRYQDPRKIILARQGLAIMTRPEWLEQLVSEIPEESEMMKGVPEEQRAGTMLDGLEQIERVAEDNDTILLMSAHGAMVILPGVGKIRFDSGKVSIRNIDAPTLDIDMRLRTAEMAKRFADSCPNLKERVIRGVPFLARGMVSNLVNRLQCKASDKFVSIHAVYKPKELEQVLNLAVAFIPRPAALQGLPPAPLPARPGPDAGSGESTDMGEATESEDQGKPSE